MCIPASVITCVRTHHAQYQKKTNESFWYCAWCLWTHVIAGAGRHFPVLLLPSTRHTRQKVLKIEQIWTSIRGWTKSKILVRKTTRRPGQRNISGTLSEWWCFCSEILGSFERWPFCSEISGKFSKSPIAIAQNVNLSDVT